MNASIEIIAHRGASYDAPENTLAAVNLAWEQNADAVEIDVRMTKDRQIIAIHDKDTMRVSGTLLKVKYHNLTELKALDVGGIKDAFWMGEQIPTLEEILDSVPKKKRIFIEIKDGLWMIPRIGEILNHCSINEERIILLDFKFESIVLLRDRFPQYQIIWNHDFRHHKSYAYRKNALQHLIDKSKLAGINGVNISACDVVSDSTVDRLKSSGFSVYIWTINDAVYGQQFIDYGVDGIMTNRPQWIREQLEL